MSAVATARVLYAPSGSDRAGQRSPWIWPLPELDGEAPCILYSSRTDRFGVLGIGYRDCSLSPICVPVFAAQEGLVTYASTTGNGPALCIDHPGGWSTQYAELDRLLVRVTDRSQ